MSNNNLWLWGYVLPKVPSNMMFISNKTYCSLETGANYLGAENVVFMDSTTSLDNLNDSLYQYTTPFKQVLCGLQHGRYAEAAEAVSEFSLTHPNVTGAIIDDFREEHGPSKDMGPQDLKQVQDALKSKNPALKLYIVRYSRHDQRELLPFKDYFDGINFWVWVSTDHYWRYQYANDLFNMKKMYGKPILQGTFIHNYGEDFEEPIPMPMLELQARKISDQFKAGMIDGWCILQNGWFDRPSHREQLQWLKNYLEWFYGTWTRRE